MNKWVAALSLAVSFHVIPAHAAIPPKAGSICSKEGITKTINGKRFTCTKSGSKLVWSKGIKLKKTKSKVVLDPSSTPTISPTPTPTAQTTSTVEQNPTPKPIQEPLTSSDSVSSIQIDFENLIESLNEIPSKVWFESQSLSQSKKTDSKIDIIFGPNTSLPLGISDPSTYLEKSSRLWKAFKQPETTKVFVFNFKDLNWAQQQLRNLGGSWFKPEELAENCQSPQNCNSFGGAFQGTGQVFLGIPIRDRYNPSSLHSNFSHEYTHVVQNTQFFNSLTTNSNLVLPCWFVEGQSMVVGESLGYSNLNSYQLQRRSWLSTAAGVLGDYSAASILRFYSKAGPSRGNGCDPEVRPRTYDVGFFTVEALAAIGGVESTMSMLSKVTEGNSFEESFEVIYGISWKKASVILSELIALQYSGTK